MSNWKSFSRPTTELFQTWYISLSLHLEITNSMFIIPTKTIEFLYTHLLSGITTSDFLEKGECIFQNLGKFLTQLCHNLLLSPWECSEPSASLSLLCLQNIYLYGSKFPRLDSSERLIVNGYSYRNATENKICNTCLLKERRAAVLDSVSRLILSLLTIVSVTQLKQTPRKRACKEAHRQHKSLVLCTVSFQQSIASGTWKPHLKSRSFTVFVFASLILKWIPH